MEQSLADLVLRRVVTAETAFARTSRAEQLLTLLESGGFPTYELAGLTSNGFRAPTEMRV
jgi:hypothetical protein